METVIDLLEEIKNTSSSNGKIELIKTYGQDELFKKCLIFLLDTSIVTGISKAKINKEVGTTYNTQIPTLSDAMDYLMQNNTGTDQDIANIQFFIANQPEEYRDWYKEFFTKRYKMGVTVKSANKAIPNLISEFNVMLGTPIEKCSLKEGEWISLSRKLNGTRAAFIGDRLISRQGKEYTGVQHIIGDLIELVGTNMFVDGELLYKNDEGLSDSEAFQKGTGIAMSNMIAKQELKLVVFDIFPLEEFWAGSSKESYHKRYEDLMRIKDMIGELCIENVEVVPILYQGTDHSQIWHWLERCEEIDWEGVMINLDTPYECKRTKNLIKVKQFKEIDLRCIKVNIADEGKYNGVVGSISCKYGNYIVDVGSGFKDEERIYYANHPDEIIGKIITIKYKEETKSKDGNNSLQFPVFVVCRFDKDTADDE